MIVPTLIRYDLLSEMIESIDYPVDHLIIIDNGGYLRPMNCDMINRVSIVKMPRNIGVATSWNLGIKLTPYEKWWFIASDDIKFTPGKLRIMAEHEDKSFIFSKGPRAFSAFAIGETIIDKVGLFNENYFPGFGEEFDYISRIKNIGIKCYNITNFYKEIGHGGNTLKMFGIDPVDTMINNVFNNDNVNIELLKNEIKYRMSAIQDYKEWNLDNRRLTKERLESINNIDKSIKGYI